MKLKLLFLTVFTAMMTIGYGQFATIGLIGDFNDWGDDVDMVQDAANADIWTLEITLPDGGVKFRADDDWAVNWGAEDFPTGVGIQEGSNIPVWAGDYFITFNSATGEYDFDVDSPIGIIGSATPGAWDYDTDMYKSQDNEHEFFIELFLNQGECKFRKDDDWVVNWGSSDFPTGIGEQDGANIPIEQAGDYMITLDTMSGAYSFSEIIAFESIGLIGEATPGGWDEETPLTQDGGNPDLWKANIELTDGECKFRANNDWAVNWGSEDWPSGIGVQDGANIPAVAGLYSVSLNTATGEYNFAPLVYYSTIGIIGNATPGGWVDDTDMEVDADDPAQWSLRVELLTGELKFRADNDWVVNWGSGDFPSGVGVQDGANVPVPEGEYLISFNTTTGAYNFQEILVYDQVGIVGTGTPLASWDDDLFLDKDPADEHHWTMSSITLVDGECKFRADAGWTVNWGAEDWPTGVGTQDGPNIPVVGGTYGISMYSNTGEYAFGDPLSADNTLLDPKDISIYPNPVTNTLYVDMNAARLEGRVVITILDNSGRRILTQTVEDSSRATLDVSNLNQGNYVIRIQGENALIGKYFSIVK